MFIEIQKVPSLLMEKYLRTIQAIVRENLSLPKEP
jgi:hypothetical protein